MAPSRAPAVAGVVCVAAVALAALARGDAVRGVAVPAVAGVALVALAGALRRPALLWLGLLLLGAADVGALTVGDQALDASVAVDGLLLFLAAELVMARVEDSIALTTTPSALRWLRVRALAGLAGACAGLLAIGAAALVPGSGLGLAVAAVVPVLLLAVALGAATREP